MRAVPVHDDPFKPNPIGETHIDRVSLGIPQTRRRAAGRNPPKDSSVRFHPLARLFVSTRLRATVPPQHPVIIGGSALGLPRRSWDGTARQLSEGVTGWSNYLGTARRSTKSQAIAVLTIGALGRLQYHSARAKESCPSSSAVARRGRRRWAILLRRNGMARPCSAA
jgi:hypothetical protein